MCAHLYSYTLCTPALGPIIRPQTAPTSLGDAARGAQSAEGAEGVAPLRRESSLFSVPKAGRGEGGDGWGGVRLAWVGRGWGGWGGWGGVRVG